MAERRLDKQSETRNDPLRKPARDTLPRIEWLRVADILVDYSYQHRPYPGAIEDLRRHFQPAYSGFILVNERDDGSLWALDGQTRCSVHQQLELHWIRAEVLTGLTQAEEAEVYLLKCINAKRMPVDFFLAEFVAKRPIAVQIHDILGKRQIEVESFATHGRKPGTEDTHVVSCVAYLKRMLTRDPSGDVLGMVLDLIKATWEFGGNTLTGVFLDSLHRLLLVHQDEISRRTFVEKLQRVHPDEIRAQALARRASTRPQITVGTALQQVIVDLYNSGRPQNRRIILGSPHRNDEV